MTLGIGLGRFATAWWLTAMLASALVTAFPFLPGSERLDDFAYDWAQRVNTRAPDPRILLVNIDNESLAAYGKWPWPRSVHARLIDRLAAGKPKAIIYDVLFLEHGPDDPALAAAMTRAGNVHIPLLLQPMDGQQAGFEVQQPVSPIRDAAAGTGHVNLTKDSDGVTREIHLFERATEVPVPHLMMGPAYLLSPPETIAKASKRPYLIPYAGPMGTFRSISAAAFLQGEVPDNLLRDRLIIVGASAEGLGDSHLMANYAKGLISGAELQANILDGLIHGVRIVEAPTSSRILFSLIPVWLLLIGFRFLKPNLTLPALFLFALASVTASLLALLFSGIWLSPVAALIALAFVYPFWAWRRLAAVSKHMIGELELLRSDADSSRPFANSSMPDDPIMRETAMLSDAVSELRSMRHFLSQSLDQLPDAVFVADAKGTIKLQNRRAHQILPVRRATDDTPTINALLARLAVSPPEWPASHDKVTFELLAKDGRNYDVRIAQYQDEYSGFDGWIIRLTDITDIRVAQRQRDEMLDFLTHDMRSPQIAILSLTAADDGKIAPDLAERIDHYAHRTLDLADDVVHLARAQSLDYEPAPVDLAAVLVDAIEEMWPQISARKTEVVRPEVGETEYLVAGEPTLLMRAMINLIDNALKYGREGGLIHCELTRHSYGELYKVHCAIHDNGIGIPRSRLTTMFERFQRGNTHRRTGGAGLGLSFVETVVTRHGGQIECESREGEGSTFTIILPLIE